MKLNIVDVNALTFNQAVGISIERANELGAQMNAIMKEFTDKLDPKVGIKTVEVYGRIAEICDSLEEMVFCTVSHTNYMQRYYNIAMAPTETRASGAIRQRLLSFGYSMVNGGDMVQPGSNNTITAAYINSFDSFRLFLSEHPEFQAQK